MIETHQGPIKIQIMDQGRRMIKSVVQNTTLQRLKGVLARIASHASMAEEREVSAGKTIWAIFYLVMSVGKTKFAMWVRLARTHTHEGCDT